MIKTLTNLYKIDYWIEKSLIPVKELLLIMARLYVAYSFLKSGLDSINDWTTTQYLYENDFHVPLLPPHVAAILGTGGELLFPILLILGFLGRISSLGLFFVNFVAYISYAYSLQTAGKMYHYIWGILLLVIILWGPGKMSLDYLLSKIKR
ncbi:DoxX [Ferrovum sp. JA12]|uniref:DoxX family protein n=1 Tax=Ferrovum sp. JA12 TaxID=1356299 RepID=UPI000702ECE3|nr:DoxX family protein [Ferrovum sp. JA12]KRH78808.1 DoxX [Ferrovum sp. JA12]HQT80967.1 DoxX family protein [Ferrovaceae bacterium]HQU06969.1 DoxX family protein [Ferrovaceae bacterium]